MCVLFVSKNKSILYVLGIQRRRILRRDIENSGVVLLVKKFIAVLKRTAHNTLLLCIIKESIGIS